MITARPRKVQATVIRWVWVSPTEYEDRTLPGSHWWNDTPPGSDALKRLCALLDGRAHWDKGWRVALRLVNGQTVYVSQKAIVP